ncbi:protein of unknown function [Streptantibioticus cattleyicolor NRRL 8057 = DSM 46488]|nr:protein of unknown function [Streptantibioticus cattleyicolor NRRL 8057 = DSM 46488]
MKTSAISAGVVPRGCWPRSQRVTEVLSYRRSRPCSMPSWSTRRASPALEKPASAMSEASWRLGRRCVGRSVMGGAVPSSGGRWAVAGRSPGLPGPVRPSGGDPAEGVSAAGGGAADAADGGGAVEGVGGTSGSGVLEGMGDTGRRGGFGRWLRTVGGRFGALSEGLLGVAAGAASGWRGRAPEAWRGAGDGAKYGPGTARI